MTTAWKVRQGRGGQFAEEMIGTEVFRGAMNSVYLEMYPEKTRIAAGLAMGNL